MNNTKHIRKAVYDDSWIGKTNNYLTVIDRVKDLRGQNKFLCLCECGNIKEVLPFSFANGVVKSCGCKARELTTKAVSTNNGASKLRIYSVWRNMIMRCENPSNLSYENYGGRGIKVCPEWHDVWKFIEWANQNGYDATAKRGKCTIDRINANGDYEPNNCRFTDMATQNNNRRPVSEWKERKKRFKYNGKMYSMGELCKIFDTSEPAVRYRMLHKGMTLKEALETPKIVTGRPRG